MTDDLFVYGRDSLRARAHFAAEQNGECAICRAIRPLCLDHEHSDEGLCRGLLCPMCNTALGLFFDDQTSLRAAVEYLERHAERNAAYRATEDAASRSVKVKAAPLTLDERRHRNVAVRAAIDRGEPTDAVARRFNLSVRQTNHIYAAD